MRISDWSSDVSSSDLNACLKRRRRVDCRPALDRRREKTPPEGLVAQGELVRCQRAGFDLGLQQGCAIRRKALRRQRLADSLALQQPKRALPLLVKRLDARVLCPLGDVQAIGSANTGGVPPCRFLALGRQAFPLDVFDRGRSEEHTSELQSPMRI